MNQISQAFEWMIDKASVRALRAARKKQETISAAPEWQSLQIDGKDRHADLDYNIESPHGPLLLARTAACPAFSVFSRLADPARLSFPRARPGGDWLWHTGPQSAGRSADDRRVVTSFSTDCAERRGCGIPLATTYKPRKKPSTFHPRLPHLFPLSLSGS
eukprot:scaffold573541_cov33-Prasinocladus_malaysianus.AAC.1